MKSVIIDRLIQIEESAQEITNLIEENEINLPVVIQKECDEIENNLKTGYEKKAEEIRAAKQKECEQKIAEIEKSSVERRKKLDDYFNANHEEWENAIFNSIIRR